MTWCKQAGIPHSEFLNWDTEDRSKALAFLIEENTKCGLCGTAEWEWDESQGGNRRAYEPVEKFCMGCYLKHVADEGSSLPGTTVSLIPTSSRQYAESLMKRKKAAYESNVH